MNFLEKMHHNNSTLTIWIDMDGRGEKAFLDSDCEVSLVMAQKAVEKGYVTNHCQVHFDGYHELASYKISQKGVKFFNEKAA